MRPWLRLGRLVPALVLLAAAGYAAYCIWGTRRVPGSASDPQEVSVLRHEARRANVVVLVLDAARADHVGCYGYPRATTPNIDRLAQEAVVFEQHFCQFTQTKESTASLFTSQYPDTHLAYGYRPLTRSAFTMAQGLTQAGFKTALFSSNFNASPALELGRHFEAAYYDPEIREVMQAGEKWWSPEPCLRLFGNWLREHSQNRFFAYIHLMPPHRPYEPPEEIAVLFSGGDPPGYSPETFRPGEYDFPLEAELPDEIHPLPEWINLYDANLRYGDWAVGEAERLLRDADAWQDTLFIVTGDHGEAFGEHGFVWHGAPIHDEGTHIPLLMRFPDGSPRGRIAALTETIDILPTVYDLFGLTYPEDEVQGHSLLELIAGTADRVRDYAFIRAPGQGGKYMVRGERYSLLLWGHAKWRTLYDLASDPEQRENVLGDRPDVGEEMAEAFREFALAQTVPPLHFLDPELKQPRLPPTREIRLAPEVKRALQNLGYLE